MASKILEGVPERMKHHATVGYPANIASIDAPPFAPFSGHSAIEIRLEQREKPLLSGRRRRLDESNET